jgi:hypothetical protein
MRFSRIINPGATGKGEHCTGCSRPLSKGSGATQRDRPAGVARREIAAIVKAAC